MQNPIDTTSSKFIIRIYYPGGDMVEMPLSGDSAHAASDTLISLLKQGLQIRVVSEPDETVTYFNLVTAAYWQIVENEFYVSPEQKERERARLEEEELLRQEEEALFQRVREESAASNPSL
jgi:hypothetical protein